VRSPAWLRDEEEWLDDHDPHATHFAVLNGDEPIAAARVCIHDKASDLPDLMSLVGYEFQLRPPIASFCRLVVDVDYRRSGLGRALDECRMAVAFRNRCSTCVGVTHLPTRQRELAKAGFRDLGASIYRTVPDMSSRVFAKEITSGEKSLGPSILEGTFETSRLSGNPQIEVRELHSLKEIETAQRLRFEVWQAEGAAIHNPEEGKIADSHDDHATHWAAFHPQHGMIGSARLCLHDELHQCPDGAMFAGVKLPVPVANLNRLVVKREFRKHGIATKLDEARVAKAREIGAAAIIVGPINTQHRNTALESRGFNFLPGITYYPSWNSNVLCCACYLIPGTQEQCDA
jgi:GNAT superfamily N-acetyltransferase